MAALSIRNLDDAVALRLRTRAAEHGRSMEAEARAILEQAVSDVGSADVVSALHERFSALGGVEFDLAARDTPARSADLSR